ncbi:MULTISPECIES: hypothetical protein [unclassified Pseudomonas]|uniref:hypothetical protein n=1 Tax=unclassified Pseudomonas TaxID=196821 RepID=UPI001F58E57D|nr:MULTISPECIES: hypothetical protein [unclassified Pseudomonas]
MSFKNEKFSTREWIFLILILLLIQFLIHWLSMKYGGSSSALGYVSFAGTVVSILLGLIAIIYSFVQSISQSSSAVEIREQIERLISAGEKITDSKNEIHKSAQELREITTHLGGQLNENTTATNKITDILSDVSKTSSVFSKPEDKTDETSYSLFNSNKIWSSISLIIIGEAIKRSWSVTDLKENILTPLSSELKISFDLTVGMTLGMLFCLESEGFIEYLNDDDNINSPIVDVGVFQTKLESIIRVTQATKAKQFTCLWKIIKNIDSK